MSGENYESGFLAFAQGDNGGGSSEKEAPKSLFEDAGKMREIFEHEQKTSAKGRKPKEQAPTYTKAEEERRVTLVRRYNAYMRSKIIVKRLVARGFQGKPVLDVTSVSLPAVESLMSEIDNLLSDSESRSIAYAGLTTINQAVEAYYPIMAEEPSLNTCFIEECKDEDSGLALSMEELAIRLDPYTPSGFFARFAMSYYKMIKETRDFKLSGKNKEFDTKVKVDEDKYRQL
jgi:hypothetical protein